MNAATPAHEQSLQPDTIYLTPRQRTFTLRSGHVYYGDALPRSEPLDFTRLFSALAIPSGTRIACVLISGASGEGSGALKHLQRAGGLALHIAAPSAPLASAPLEVPELVVSTALAPLAPLTAITAITGRAQTVPAWSAARVVDALRAWSGYASSVTDADKSRLDAIGQYLHATFDLDLTMHKDGILAAHVAARVKARRVEGLEQYTALLEGSREELVLLRDAVLIGATRFFRDEAVFASLQERVFATLGQGDPSAAIRVWVPACSTGEEAYSLAILLREWLDGRGERRPLRIYATDVRDSALNFARRGVYSARIANELSRERLERWFVPRRDGYEVVRSLRDGIVWGRHNLLVDPPFLNIDLLSCRNLLVYLHRRAQALVFSKFHFSLREHGVLLIGSAESTMAAGRTFEPVDYASRLYRKRSHLESTRFHGTLKEPVRLHGTETPR